MNKDALSGLEVATVKDVGPDGEEGFREGSGFDEGKAIRNGQHQGCIGDAILRIAAAADKGANGVTYGVGLHIAAKSNHSACDFKAQSIG